MSDEPINTPDTTPVTPPDKGRSESQGNQQVNWEARYNGLNKTYDALKKKYDALQDAHNQINAEHEELKQTLKGHEAEKAKLSSSLLQYETEKSELEKKVASSSFKTDRALLIMGDYSDLSKFEKDGLLPSADTLDELKPKLDAFRAALGANIDNGVKDKLKGTGPAPSGKNDTPAGSHSEEYIYTRLQQLAGHRTPEQETEYLGLRDEWDTIQSKK